MMPARETRDFSIESILADKRENSFARNERTCQLGVRTKEREDSSTKNNFEGGCTTTEQETNDKLSEMDDRDINFRKKSDTDAKKKCKTNSEIFSNECRNNSIAAASFEYNRNENKLHIDNESDRNISECSEREKLNSNETNAPSAVRCVQNGRAVNSKSFEPEEIDRNCEQTIGNNFYKTFDKELNTEQKTRLKYNQSEQFNDGCIKYSNKNCSGLEKQYKTLRCNLNGKFDTTHNKHLFENRNKGDTEFSRGKTEKPEVIRDIEKLEWLHCTRYRPPKIPRKPTIGKSKRKPSFYPRIPFSMFQLDFLEQKFQNSAYLSKNDVLDISDVLKLPPNRIKIWFQNRRARERREFCTNI